MGFTLFYLSLIVLIPLAALFLKAASAGPSDIWAVATSPRTARTTASAICRVVLSLASARRTRRSLGVRFSIPV